MEFPPLPASKCAPPTSRQTPSTTSTSTSGSTPSPTSRPSPYTTSGPTPYPTSGPTPSSTSTSVPTSSRPSGPATSQKSRQHLSPTPSTSQPKAAHFPKSIPSTHSNNPSTRSSGWYTSGQPWGLKGGGKPKVKVPEKKKT